MKHWKRKAGILLGILILIGIYYYISLPAINIHAVGFWTFILALLGVLLALVSVRALTEKEKTIGVPEKFRNDHKSIRDLSGCIGNLIKTEEI